MRKGRKNHLADGITTATDADGDDVELDAMMKGVTLDKGRRRSKRLKTMDLEASARKHADIVLPSPDGKYV